MSYICYTSRCLMEMCPVLHQFHFSVFVEDVPCLHMLHFSLFDGDVSCLTSGSLLSV